MNQEETLLYRSSRFGFELRWSRKRPFVRIVKYEVWGEFGPRGWIRSR